MDDDDVVVMVPAVAAETHSTTALVTDSLLESSVFLVGHFILVLVFI